MLVGVLDHDDGRVDHGADGDGDATQAHDVGVHSKQAHCNEGDQHTHRQHQDRHQRTAKVQQEDHADECNNQRFLNKRVAQGLDGAVDQLGAVIDRLHGHALRQAG